MEQRLQKALSAFGVASRRSAEQMILDGRITVNGEVAQLGAKVVDTDEIAVDGKIVSQKPETVYLLLNKPRGYVTTLDDEEGRKTVADLVADCGTRVYPVGRLDLNSEGLLLLTNDGAVANAMMHPSGEVGKTYHAWVGGYNEGTMDILQGPMTLDGYKLRPAQVDCQWHKDNGLALLTFTIFEGRNRQIRRMCGTAGLRVNRLKRVREGKLELGSLAVGKWRYLTEEEMEYVRKINQ